MSESSLFASDSLEKSCNTPFLITSLAKNISPFVPTWPGTISLGITTGILLATFT